MVFFRMTDLNLAGKRVLIREDLNVPIENGRISATQRLDAALPTLRRAAEAGARVLVMSHLGRPEEGVFDPAASLAPIAKWLSAALGQPVPLIGELDVPPALGEGAVALLENVRFNPGEKRNDDVLAKRYAALCDVFVMDAFGTAHRAQASTHGVARFAPLACAGPLLCAELDALTQALHAPARPLLAIVAGAKVSTKLELLESLAGKVDQLIVGGGIANTFLAATGHPVGKSLHEAGLLDTSRRILAAAKARGADIPLPSDVVVATELSAEAQAAVKAAGAVGPADMILDIGPNTAQHYAHLIAQAGTVVWNGPVGVFEFEAFGHGTRILAQAIADSAAFSVAGGGDTLAAIAKYGVQERMSYISTGGGAFLEFLEGKTLPAVAMLETRARSQPA